MATGTDLAVICALLKFEYGDTRRIIRQLDGKTHWSQAITNRDLLDLTVEILTRGLGEDPIDAVSFTKEEYEKTMVMITILIHTILWGDNASDIVSQILSDDPLVRSAAKIFHRFSPIERWLFVSLRERYTLLKEPSTEAQRKMHVTRHP